MATAVKVKMHVSNGQDGKKRVVFAEAGADFVDIIFSFLTLPLGTIVRILGKESSVGCLDDIYKSVELLSAEHFQTKACKHMLLNPLNAAAELCSKLAINVDDTKHGEQYVCKNPNCVQLLRFSSVPNTVCVCGHVLELKKGAGAGVGSVQDGVFVRAGGDYIVTDKLLVLPSSTRSVLAVLESAGIKDAASMEVQDVVFNKDKIISLLKAAMQSNDPLTAVLFGTTETKTEPDDIPGGTESQPCVPNPGISSGAGDQASWGLHFHQQP